MTELEKKLQQALDAADKAFEAGYPVKAHSIVKGALTLLVQRPKLTKRDRAFIDQQALGQPCRVCHKHGCHDAEHQKLRATYEDAMNH